MVGTTSIPALDNSIIDQLLDWHDSKKTILENPGSIGLNTPWVHTKIRDSDPMEKSIQIKNSISGSPWNLDFVENFPTLVESFNQLPLNFINKILILETVKECVPHIDGSSRTYLDKSIEPCNYRMLLRKPKNSKGFYVQPLLKENFGISARKEIDTPYSKNYYSPEIGKWWVLNNWCCQHGSDWLPEDNKALISVIGTPSNEHKQILNSLSNTIKHPDYT